MKRRNANDNFYSLVGIPFSENSPIFDNEVYLENYNNEYNLLNDIPSSEVLKNICEDQNTFMGDINNCDLGSLRNKEHLSWKEQLYNPSTLFVQDNTISEVPNDADSFCLNNETLYLRAANNLRSFLNKKKLLRTDKCDKVTQTFCSDTSNSKINRKNCDKSNQTQQVLSRNVSVSAKVSLKSNKTSKDISIAEKNINFQTCINKASKLKITHTIPQPYNFNYSTTNRSKNMLKDPNTAKNEDFMSFHSDKSDGTKSKFDEITLISNLKLKSLNSSLENFGLKTQHIKDFKMENHIKELIPKNLKKEISFWDNLPLQAFFEKIRLSTLSKSLLIDKKIIIKKDICRKNKSEKSVNDNIITSDGDMKKFSQKKGSLNSKVISEPTLKNSTRTKFIGFGDKRKLSDVSSDLKVYRFFNLNQYDELVKSYLNSKDRRIKSVCAKHECSLKLEVPFNPEYEFSTKVLSISNVVYKCTISSTNSENLDKCINYLKDTFPNTSLERGIKDVLK